MISKEFNAVPILIRPFLVTLQQIRNQVERCEKRIHIFTKFINNSFVVFIFNSQKKPLYLSVDSRSDRNRGDDDYAIIYRSHASFYIIAI